jgi:hypothetical protein
MVARRRPGIRSKHAAKKTDVVMRRHADGHSCYYGCTPAVERRCANCPEDDCMERVGSKRSEHYYRTYGGRCRRVMLTGHGNIDEYPNVIKNAKRCMRTGGSHPHGLTGDIFSDMVGWTLAMKKVR